MPAIHFSILTASYEPRGVETGTHTVTQELLLSADCAHGQHCEADSYWTPLTSCHAFVLRGSALVCIEGLSDCQVATHTYTLDMEEKGGGSDEEREESEYNEGARYKCFLHSNTT